MRYGTWDTLFNLLLLLFWFRIWVRDDRDLFFNPHLAFLSRITTRIFAFLQPVFLGTPVRIVALCVFVFLVVFRAVLFHGVSTTAESTWILKMGVWRAIDVGELFPCLVYSVLSFGIALFNLWGISLLYLVARSGSSSDHTRRALHHLAAPFSETRYELKPLALLLLGCGLVVGIATLGYPVPSLGMHTGLQVSLEVGPASVVAVAARVVLAAMAGFVDILALLATLMLVLVIVSLVSGVTNTRAVQFFSREWILLLLGPLRRRPIVVGMLDLTPLVFLLVVQMFVHPILAAFIAATAGLIP